MRNLLHKKKYTLTHKHRVLLLVLGMVGIMSLSLLILIEVGWLARQHRNSLQIKTDYYEIPKIAEIRSTSPSVYQYLKDQAGEIIAHKDVGAMIELTLEAFQSEAIDMFECHSLAHMIGHHAAEPEHFSHIEGHITFENVNFCGGGFMHGIEGGLAMQAGAQEKLFGFCNLILPLATVYSGCYHGAGHAFMDKTDSLKDSFALCDSLIMSKGISSEHCYRGALSQLIDGELRPTGKDNAFLLGFCSSLSKNLRRFCALELGGMDLDQNSTVADVAKTLRDCLEIKLDEDVRSACLTGISGVGAHIILARNNTINPPDFILALSSSLRRSYLLGTANEMLRLINDGLQRDWTLFCGSFPDGSDKRFCHDHMVQGIASKTISADF